MFMIVSDDRRFVDYWRALMQSRCGSGDHTETRAEVKDALVLAEQKRMQLGIVDLGHKGLDALSSAGELAQLARRMRLLLVRPEFSCEAEIAALTLGVVGCCSSQALSPVELERIVDVVLKGGVWISRQALPEMLGVLRQAAARKAPPRPDAKLSALTPREREIADLVAEGVANKVIAKRLGVSDLTVKAHMTMILRKMGVSSRVQLALLLSGSRQAETV